MFTMMNSARINVGSQGVQIAERALQAAQDYARDRVQSARAGSADKALVAIVGHPDVRRMLLRMRALTEGARARCCTTPQARSIAVRWATRHATLVRTDIADRYACFRPRRERQPGAGMCGGR